VSRKRGLEESSSDRDRHADARRPWRRVAQLALLLAGLVAVECAYRYWRVRSSGWGQARFVWAEDARGGAARAFYVARDFRVPEGARLSGARLVAMGDEEYQIHLNGAWVGGGSYRLGAPAGQWDVSELLRVGGNRLVVEARSATGVGGVVLAVFLGGDEQPFVATDATWRVFGRHADGLVEGTFRIDDGDAPRVLGRPPRGRWETPRPGTLRAPAPLLAREAWAERLARVPRQTVRPDAAPVWSVDFGVEVEGTLELWSDLGSCGCPLRYFSNAEERDTFYSSVSAPQRAQPVSRTFVMVPGAPRWRDVEPRRFRYVTLEAQEPPTAARVLLGAATASASPVLTGPFGLQPPPARAGG
jgi:hypothetical protein